MKFTNREKNLLAILGILAVGSLIVFMVIMPLQQSIASRQATNLSLIDQKNLLDAQIENGKTLDAKLTTALQQVEAEFSKIEGTTTSDEFELRVQPYFLGHDIKIESWVVNEPAITKPEIPTYQKNPYDYKLQALLDSYLSQADTQIQIPVSDSELLKTTITVTFTSNYSVYLGFLDEIAGWKSTVYVTSANREATSGTAVVTIDVYSVSKP